MGSDDLSRDPRPVGDGPAALGLVPEQPSHLEPGPDDGRDDLADHVDGRTVDSGAGGQGEDPGRYALRNRQQQASVREVGAARLQPVAARVEVPSGQDSLGVKDLDELVAADPGLVLVDLHDNILIIATFPLVIGQDAEPGDGGQASR